MGSDSVWLGDRHQGSQNIQGGAAPSSPLAGVLDWFDGTLRPCHPIVKTLASFLAHLVARCCQDPVEMSLSDRLVNHEHGVEG
jgi:hypothetical protein